MTVDTNTDTDITTHGFAQLPIGDQLAAIHSTARTAAHLDTVEPEAAAALRGAALTAAELAGLRTVWGAEPHINPHPAITYLQTHGDTAPLDAVLSHVDTMRREARTGVMLAGYPDPHHAEVAQRQRFITALETLGLPEAVIDQIRTSPLANPESTTSSAPAAARPTVPRPLPAAAPTAPRSPGPTF